MFETIGLEGKDGAFYNNVNDLMAANTRYEQQENIKNELKRQNDLMERQLNQQNNYQTTSSNFTYTPMKLVFKPNWYHVIMFIVDIIGSIFLIKWVLDDIGYRIPYAIAGVVFIPILLLIHFYHMGLSTEIDTDKVDKYYKTLNEIENKYKK